MSATTHLLLVAGGGASVDEWEATGGIMVKGKGKMETFVWQEGVDNLNKCDIASAPLYKSSGVDLVSQRPRSVSAITKSGDDDDKSNSIELPSTSLGLRASPGSSQGLKFAWPHSSASLMKLPYINELIEK